MLSYGKKLSTGIQCQTTTSQPTTHIDKFNGQLTMGENTRARPRMPGPPKMEHPYENLPKEEKSPFAHQEETSTKRGKTWSYTAFASLSPKMPS